MGLSSIITRQPFKAIWILLAFEFALLRLPFWILYYIPKHLRPSRNWTYAQALRNQIIKIVLYNTSIVRQGTPTPLEPGAEKERFAVAQPARGELYKGPLDDAEIKPAAVGGTWFPNPYKSGDVEGPGQPVILHAHGGAVRGPRSPIRYHEP
jgi:hypothetical protein